MIQEVEAQTLSRPIRIAFLVEDGEHSHLVLDGIFADAFRRWGGRFSLIVPCDEGRIRESYWDWLVSYDPDVVYSYVQFTRERVVELHDRLCPAEYVQHQSYGKPRLDVFGFKPDYKFTPLASLSTIFRQARYRKEGALKIIDSWYTEKPSRFLTDNFGTYHWSFGTSLYPNDARPAATLKTIVADERYEDRQFGIPRDLDRLRDEREAFEAFSRREITSVSLASCLFASKLEIHSHRWSEAFNLVVGESFEDRLLCWNARLYIPNWLDSDFCSLRVEPAQLEDETFVAALGNFLNVHNHVNDGRGGQSAVAIRSASLSIEKLEEVTGKLKQTKLWSDVRCEQVQSLEEIVPNGDALKRANERIQFRLSLAGRSGWRKFGWTPPFLRPPQQVPDHLVDAPVEQQFTRGLWATDFSISFEKTRYGQYQQNVWQLPLRWRVTGAFEFARAKEINDEIPPRSRRSRPGALTVFSTVDAPVAEINVPDGRDAIYFALSMDGYQFGQTVEDDKARPEPRVFKVVPSNEARYLAGVIGMAGGLNKAASFLLHSFLADTFAKLGGSPKPPEDKIQPTINKLKKRTKPGQALFNVQNEGERSALASLIVQAANGLKAPRETVSYNSLKANWDVYRARYREAHPRERPAAEEIEKWDQIESDTLQNCLIELRKRQMLFQGHRWVCHNCHHKNWINLGDLGAELNCVVCNSKQSTPIDIDWQFRPNEFLIECLRDRGVLPVIWVLDLLRGRSRTSFFYAPPTMLYFSQEAFDRNQPDAEADLLVLVDGQAILCEVKLSWTFVSAAHIKSLVALALKLRPDKAIFAVMDKKGAKFGGALEEARTKLAEVNVSFELITLENGGLGDQPYLPS